MSGPMNRLPIGLLSLLDLKAPSGRYPLQLNDVMSPELDMMLFYRAGAHRGSQDVIPAASITGSNRFVGFPNVMTVPPSESWFLAEFSAEADSIDADQSITYACAISIPFQASANIFRLGDYVTGTGAALGSRPIAIASFGMPRILPGGTQLGVTVMAFTAGAALNTSMLGMHQRLSLTT